MPEPTPTPVPKEDERKLRFTEQIQQMVQSGMREALSKLMGYEPGQQLPEEEVPGAGTKPLPRQLTPGPGAPDLASVQERLAMEQMMGVKRPVMDYMLTQGE